VLSRNKEGIHRGNVNDGACLIKVLPTRAHACPASLGCTPASDARKLEVSYPSPNANAVNADRAAFRGL
jgi:hypothetical protein